MSRSTVYVIQVSDPDMDNRPRLYLESIHATLESALEEVYLLMPQMSADEWTGKGRTFDRRVWSAPGGHRIEG